MEINVTLGEAEKTQEKTFPKLMQVSYNNPENVNNKGLVVLFSSPEIGFVVVGTEIYEIGSYNKKWAMDLFTDYNEPITLQNA